MVNEEIKKDFISQSEKLNKFYQKVPTQGEFVNYPSDDGEKIECVYFKVDKPNAPLMIEVHGGGHVTGHARDDENMCVRIRKELGCNVLTINYRLAPKYPFPRPVYDVYQAILGIINDKTKDFSRDNVYLIGHSAGANLIVSSTILINRNHDFKLKGIICNYPAFDLTIPAIDRPQFKESLPSEICELFNDLYVPNVEDRKNPLASPIYLKDDEAKLFPNTLLLLSGKDSLMVDGLCFRALLEKNNVKNTTIVFQDAPHGFFEDAFKDNGYKPKGATEEELKMMKKEQIRLSERSLEKIEKFYFENER